MKNIALVAILIILVLSIQSCQPAPEPTPDRITSVGFTLYWPYMSAGGQSVPLRGVAASDGGETLSYICPAGYEWRKVWSVGNWNSYPCPGLEHVPMLAWGVQAPPTNSAQSAYYLSLVHDSQLSYYRLFYNECEASSQCNADPTLAATHYGQIVQGYLDLGGHMGDIERYWIVGGTNFQECGLRWLEIFWQAYEDEYGTPPPHGGIHFHPYGDIKAVNPGCPTLSRTWVYAPERLSDGPDAYWNDFFKPQLEEAMTRIQALTDGEVWITEIGCLHGGCYGEFTLTLEEYFSEWVKDSDVVRYAWYADYDEDHPYWSYTYLVDPIMRVLTQLGAQYFSVDAYP